MDSSLARPPKEHKDGWYLAFNLAEQRTQPYHAWTGDLNPGTVILENNTLLGGIYSGDLRHYRDEGSSLGRDDAYPMNAHSAAQALCCCLTKFSEHFKIQALLCSWPLRSKTRVAREFVYSCLG